MANSHSHEEPTNRPLKNLALASALAALLSISAPKFAEAQTKFPLDPMEDKYSHAIRAEYSKCRELANPMARFLCSCRVLVMQCDAPRKLEHGDWNTIEFWPSKDAKDREVQFILLMNYDLLGDLSPVNKGVVLTCMEEFTGLDIFLGPDLSPDINPIVTVGKRPYKTQLKKDDGVYALKFLNEAKLFEALKQDLEITITYSDTMPTEHNITFDTFGFSHVTNGWEKLCAFPSNKLKNKAQEEMQ